MWSCCPSTFNPWVGPNVVPDAGEPASPNAAAAAKTAIASIGLKPRCINIGTNNTAKIGIVPKEVPIPIVINRPTISIKNAANSFEPSINGIRLLTKLSIAPVDCNTPAKPAATSITNATYPIIPIPSFIRISIFSGFIARVPKIIVNPIKAPSGNDLVHNWTLKVAIAANRVI